MPDETHLAHTLRNYSFCELESAAAVPWSEVTVSRHSSVSGTYIPSVLLSLMFGNLGVCLCVCVVSAPCRNVYSTDTHSPQLDQL